MFSQVFYFYTILLSLFPTPVKIENWHISFQQCVFKLWHNAQSLIFQQGASALYFLDELKDVE